MLHSLMPTPNSPLATLMIRQIRSAVMCLLVLTLLTGVAYPLLVTGVAQTLFPRQARGSLIVEDSQIVGSGADRSVVRRAGLLLGPLIGHFARSVYGVQCREIDRLVRLQFRSAESGLDRRREGADRRACAGRSRQRRADSRRLDDRLRQRLGSARQPRGRLLPGRRVAAARKLDEGSVRKLIEEHVEGRQLGLLGEPRVNVLKLNLALDKLKR